MHPPVISFSTAGAGQEPAGQVAVNAYWVSNLIGLPLSLPSNSSRPSSVVKAKPFSSRQLRCWTKIAKHPLRLPFSSLAESAFLTAPQSEGKLSPETATTLLSAVLPSARAGFALASIAAAKNVVILRND